MTTPHTESLGRRIARLRLAHGMTQERLANVANVSAQAVSKWENGQSYPDILLLPLLAKTFGVTVDELLGVDDTAPTETAPATTAPVNAQQQPTETDDMATELPVETATSTSWTSSYETFEQPSAADPLSEPAAMPAYDEPDPPSDVGQNPTITSPASHIRLRVTRAGREAVNLTFPLVAARLLSNVVTYFPERLVEGVDIAALARSAQNAGTGTLVDVDDGDDRVVITLE